MDRGLRPARMGGPSARMIGPMPNGSDRRQRIRRAADCARSCGTAPAPSAPPRVCKAALHSAGSWLRSVAAPHLPPPQPPWGSDLPAAHFSLVRVDEQVFPQLDVSPSLTVHVPPSLAVHHCDRLISAESGRHFHRLSHTGHRPLHFTCQAWGGFGTGVCLAFRLASEGRRAGRRGG